MSKLCCSKLLNRKNRLNSEIVFRCAVGKNISHNNEKHRFMIINSTFQRNFNTSVRVNNDDEHMRKFEKYGASGLLIATAISGAIAYYAFNSVYAEQAIKSDTATSLPQNHRSVRNDLPTFSMDDVSKHNTLETGIWVTYGIGVYDITKFVPQHPGSDKIMIGAGASIDPFWHIYQQHNTPEILKLLETFRIGNLSAEDDVGTKDLSDPWANEPKRHPLLKPTSLKPFNAEPPISLLVEQFLTPADIFYVRNHLPVPEIDVQSYELEIEIEETDKTKTFSFEDIKALPKHNVTAAIMCGGNRRSEMTNVKPVKGLSWGSAAVGNAIWSGPKLCDVLRKMGVESDENRHVQFEGFDMDPMSTHYAASIPLTKAMDPRGDVILAYEMNGEPLSSDHGYPVRVICPGIVGARNVKWLGRIVVSKSESDSHWQQNDYKGFSPSTDWDTVDFTKSPAIQNMPVTSAICYPNANDSIAMNENGCITVKGYAWSGGGNKIVRVDLTADGGNSWQIKCKSWHVAKLKHGATDDIDQSNLNGRNWAWTLWTAEIPVPKGAKGVEIWSKAVDSNYNVQPETFSNIWNLRGVLSNAYNRVKVNIV